jgi:hypothetical protein
LRSSARALRHPTTQAITLFTNFLVNVLDLLPLQRHYRASFSSRRGIVADGNEAEQLHGGERREKGIV